MLQSFSVFELASAVALMMGACGGVVRVIQQSRCSNIRFCGGCFECQRVPPAGDDGGEGGGGEGGRPAGGGEPAVLT
jgi:hypothetical protein